MPIISTYAILMWQEKPEENKNIGIYNEKY